jgi:hypothetical protein
MTEIEPDQIIDASAYQTALERLQDVVSSLDQIDDLLHGNAEILSTRTTLLDVAKRLAQERDRLGE